MGRRSHGGITTETRRSLVEKQNYNSGISTATLQLFWGLNDETERGGYRLGEARFCY